MSELVEATTMATLPRRMLRASLLDAHLYEEVEADRQSTGQATLVVVLAAVAAAVGSIENHGIAGILWFTPAALVGWYVWAFAACVIGTRLLPGPQTAADHGELLRTIGFSSAPGVLRILGLISPIAGWVFLLCTLWMLVAMVVAVRQALDYEGTGRAIAVCVIGFPVYALTLVATLILLGPWPL
jgi:hypothetical protein